jgi:acetyl-CoA carboxylase biotin carboxyl carrier protein
VSLCQSKGEPFEASRAWQWLNRQFEPLNGGLPLDLKEIKQIIDLMKRSDLTELEVEQEGLKLRICRGAAGQFVASSSAAPAPGSESAAPPAAPSAPASSPAPSAEAALEEGVVFVRSPMVGTFYRSAAPDVPPFAELNQKITEDGVICIIEAMKVMNEIQAEVKGTVIEILVENGQPVEYGQPLFKVKKS